MSHNIRREAADIADDLDNGNGQWAANRLREDLQQMRPDEAMQLLQEIQRQEQRGYGSDVVVERLQHGRRGQEYLSVNVESLIYDRRYGEQLISQPVGTVALPYYDQRDRNGGYDPRFPNGRNGGHHGGHHGGHRRDRDGVDPVVPFIGGLILGTVLGQIGNNNRRRR